MPFSASTHRPLSSATAGIPAWASAVRALCPREILASGGRELEQFVEQLAVEGFGFGGALHLHEAAVTGHHDVHVGIGPDVLFVAEIGQRYAVDGANRHG